MKTLSGKFIAAAFALLLACIATPTWAQNANSAAQEAGAVAGSKASAQKRQAPQTGKAVSDPKKKFSGLDPKSAGGFKAQPVQKQDALAQKQDDQPQNVEGVQGLDGQTDVAADGEKMLYEQGEASAETVSSAPPKDQLPPAPPQEQESSSLSILIAILALILAVIALYLATRKKQDKHRRGKELSAYDVQACLETSLAQANRHVAAQNDDIKRLTTTIFHLESRVEALEREKTASGGGMSGGGSSHNVDLLPVSPSRGKSYAAMPKGGVIDGANMAEQPSMEYFIEVTAQGNTATFAFSTDERTQRYLLINFNFTIKNLCTVKSRVDAPSRIVTRERGRLQKEGNGWRITQLPVVSLE